MRTTTPVVGVQLNAPPDTIQVGRIIYVTTETVFTANHLTDTDKQNSTGKYKTKYNSEKSNNAKYSKTKLPWFSRLLRHSARKRDGLILQRPEPTRGNARAKQNCRYIKHLTIQYNAIQYHSL